MGQSPAGTGMGTDGMGAREVYRAIILDNIEYEYLVQADHIDREQLDELAELIRNIESIREAVDCGDREKIVALLSAAREKKEKFG